MTRTKTKVNQDVVLLDMIEMSEPGNALRLALIGQGKIHYVETLGVWYAYEDGRWKMDANGIGLQGLSKLVPRSIFTMAATLEGSEQDEDYHTLHITWARKSNTEPQLKRMVTLARDLDGIRISHEELDAKPWLFNCQNGTYDFMTNTFRDHDPADLLTKMANVWYDPDAKCPAWLGYLDEWQPDKNVQRFLAEIAGSGLTGIPVQNLFINHGEGRNGKGTFYKTVQLILGEYASTAPEDMIVESRFKIHDEEKAKLRGCRFLLAPETSVGDRLNEAAIKNLTGGDIIHARHLYGRPFDFKPTHTAFLHTNHRPQIRGTDPAIWSRVIEISWLATIEADRRDMLIDDKLEAERSGILNWLIAGCQGFKRHGVKPPKAIMDATEEYRQAEDTIARFVDETFDAMVRDAHSLGEVDYIPAATLRKTYEEWCRQEGMRTWSAMSVAKELRRLGWSNTGSDGTKRIGGVVIKTWTPPVSGKSGNTQTTEPLVQDQTVTAVTSVTPDLYLNHIEESKGGIGNEGINIETAVTREQRLQALEDAEREADHREWLRIHGYPVPPTDEELDEYWSTFESAPEEPTEPTEEPPPWEEE